MVFWWYWQFQCPSTDTDLKLLCMFLSSHLKSLKILRVGRWLFHASPITITCHLSYLIQCHLKNLMKSQRRGYRITFQVVGNFLLVIAFLYKHIVYKISSVDIQPTMEATEKDGVEKKKKRKWGRQRNEGMKDWMKLSIPCGSS